VGCSAGDVQGGSRLDFFVCEERWVRQKMRLEKEKAFVCGLRVKLYCINTNPFIKQGLD
jgi:hypothetical protein